MEIRSKENVKNHGEVFTPFYIIDEMLELIPEEAWADPSYVFLEPTCGNGNFLRKVAHKRFLYDITPIECFNTLLGMDISKENIQDSRMYLARLAGWMLKQNKEDVDSPSWRLQVCSIMAILINNVFQVEDSLTILRDYPNGVLGEKKFVIVDPTGNNEVLPKEERNSLIKRCVKLFDNNKEHPIVKEFYHYVRS